MGVTDGSDGLGEKRPRAPVGAVRPPVTLGRKNPLPAGTQQAELREGKAKAPGTCRSGRPPWLLCGAQSQVQIQRID